MPLKRLELSNFKSYRGQQTIDFGHSPFACIIGPNGSGKSNLMDAISFVLGVKSAQLRSTQLKDLVYRGRKLAGAGQKRKADDAVDEDSDEADGSTSEGEDETNDAKTAWVMAVYADDKGKEYKFKRLISTNGTSSYQLNGKNVTWTIYNQTLEQHNILVKAKNFLVFQGDVEQIASQSSKDLAKLVDSISGSADLAAAYNTAKAAQEKAQELATSNFTKKRGIASELKQFKEQKEEVARWEQLREQKDEVVLQQILWRLFHIDAAIDTSVANVEKASGQLKPLRKDVKSQDKKFEDKRKAQSAAKLELKKAQSAVTKAEKALEERKPDLLALETQIAHSIKKSSNAAGLAERVKKDETRQGSSVKDLRDALKIAQKNADAAAAKQRSASAQKGVALNTDDLAEYRKLRSQANVLAVAERQKLEGIRREQKAARSAVAAVREKLEVFERKRAALLEQTSDLQERDQTMTDKVESLKREKQEIKAELDKAQAERARINTAETELNEKLQHTFNMLLQAGVDKRDSDREVKLKETITNLKRIFNGVHGRVVDLVKPTARKYETAVMTVLGRNIDAIVVDHEKTAIECIEYMRNQRAGQATFIPLDTIQVQPIQEKYRNFVKGARLAIDVIQCDTVVARAVQHACGSSLICDTLDIAKHVRYDLNQEVKAVSLEGTVVHKSGLMTGGQGAGQNRRFEESEITNLNRMKEKYISELAELAKSKPKNKTDDALQDKITRINVELGIAKDDLDATRLRLESDQKELDHIQSEIKQITPDLEKRAKASAGQDEQSNELLQVVNTAEDKVFTAFCKRIKVGNIREYEDVQLRVAEEESEARVKFDTQIARLTHQLSFETEQLKNTRERLESLEATINSEKAGLAELQKNQKTLEAELSQAESEIEELRAEVETAQDDYQQAAKASEDAKAAAASAQKALDLVLREIAASNDEIERLAADRRALYRRCKLEDIDLPLVKGSLNKVPLDEVEPGAPLDADDDGTQRPLSVDDYGIEVDFESLEDDERADGTSEMAASFDKRLTQITTEIDRMAPNMKAVDKFDDVQTKLNETEKEAKHAKEESTKARDEFNDLKKRRCDLFNKAFSHMSGCIDKVYKDLTKGKAFPMGGVAYLSLEDDDEPYLSGVKYNTMPPGKRFVEIEQLSGGEKTMAALALLFAIHSYQPSPFFVLDEVDAALDNTNVAKLANYIREQASPTFQFLIISLKASLYERSDSLVGVYREQEINSSRTLTLDLQQYDE